MKTLSYSGPCNSVSYLGHSKNVSWWWWWWWTEQMCCWGHNDRKAWLFGVK